MSNVVKFPANSLIEFEERALGKIARFSKFSATVPEMLSALDYDKRAQAAVEGMIDVLGRLEEAIDFLEERAEEIIEQLREDVVTKITLSSAEDGQAVDIYARRRCGRIFILDFSSTQVEQLRDLSRSLEQSL